MAKVDLLSRSFKDISFSFDSHPKTKDILVKRNEAAIKSALKHLILTNIGERPFQPELGTNLSRLLFEPCDFGTASQISDEITRVIRKYEERVVLSLVDVNPIPENNAFDVSIEFEIVGIPHTQIIEFYLESTR